MTDVVLTTVPSTALPVLAAENEAVVAQAEMPEEATTPADESTEPEDPSEPAEDLDEDIPDDGQNDEKGDDDSDEDLPPADDGSDDVQDDVPDDIQDEDQDVPDENGAGPEEELPEETEDAVVEGDTSVTGSHLDSLEDESKAKSTILVQEKKDGELAAPSTVDVQFTDGCASEDGSEVRKDTDITFLVLPNEGYKLKSIGRASAADASTFNKDTSLTAVTLAGEGPYTIGKNELSGDKSLLIVVETEEIDFNLTAKGATLNKVEEAEDGTKSLKAFTADDNKVAKSDASSIEFAIEVPAGKTYVVTAQAKDGKVSDPLAGTEGTIGTGNTAKNYKSYTLDATTLDGVKIGNNDIDVTVNVEEVVAKTVNAKAATVGTGYSIAPVTIGEDATDAQKAYKRFVNSVSAGAYNAGDKVAFVLTPDANSDYDLDGIEAKLTKGEDTIELDKAEDITAIFFPDATANTAKSEAYAVAIPPTLAESGYALDLTVKTKLERNKTTITFTSDNTDVLTIKGGVGTATDVEAGTVYRVAQTGKYKTEISSREGYQITKAEVTVKGAYNDSANGSFPDYTYVLDGTENEDGSIDNYPRYMVSGDIDLTGAGTPNANPADTKAWKATEVTINIVVSNEVDGADEQKTVAFTNNSAVAGGIPYVLVVDQPDEEDNKVTYDKITGETVIAENTKYLSFTVNAETEPEVKVDLDGDDTNDETDKTFLEKVGSGFSYRIPAKAFVGNKGSITITRKTATIAAEVPGNNATVAYSYTENKTTKSGALSGTATVDIDANVNFTVEQVPDAAPITGVTWQYGEEGTPTPVAESDEGYLFSAKTTEDEIIVKVAYATDERIFVNNGGNLKEIDPNDTEPVEVDYENTISAYVQDGKGAKVSLINALVYDGAKLAQTKAGLEDSNKMAVIKSIAESEQGKPLTVTLVKADRTRVSFNIKPDKKAEEVSYSGLDSDGNLTLGVDMQRWLQVDVKDAKAGKLDAAVIEDAAELPKTVTDPKTANDNISVYYYNGSLRITALSKDAGVDKAGVVVLYRTTDTDAAKTIVSGSEIRVKTEAPFMKGENVNSYNPTGTVVGRNYTVKMDEAALKAVAEKAAKLGRWDTDYQAKAYYTVKAAPSGTWTKPEGMTQAEFDSIKAQITNYLKTAGYTDGKEVSASRMLADGGCSIRLIPDEVAPIELSFEVKITPVQVLADTGAVIKGTSWKSGAISTAKVNYSETLKLGKGESKLTTGRDEDIVVATPEFAEGGNNRYNWVVEPKIINAKTGMTHDYAYAFDAKWNPAKGTVTVNAAGAKAFDNKYFNDYKDLAIKITVFTETGDYGVSGTKKLTVQNGIEDVDLTVQPEILYKGKKLTVNTTIGYNVNDEGTNHYNDPSDYTSDYAKYRAPQVKKASYELGDVGKALQGKVSINPTNGKITLEKDITLSNNAADNTFDVYAKANDYEGNDTWANDDYSVTVIGEVEKLNELALFDVSNNNYAKAQKLEVTNQSKFEVNRTSGQYVVAVLKDGVKTNADGTYNLTNYSNLYDTNLLTFTSSNKGIKVYPNGSIEVNKVGKTTITAALKSDKKEKLTLKNVNFVVENQPIVAKLTQYQNSDFTNAFTVDDKNYFEQNGDYPAQGSTTTGYYLLEFCKKVTNEDGEVEYSSFTLPNYSVSFGKTAKKAVNRASSNNKVYFTATGAASTVTITNKEKDYKNSNKIVININNAADANLQNAPKVQLLTDRNDPILAGKEKDLNVKVTPAKKTDNIWDAEKSTYVILSVDQSKKTKASVSSVFSRSLDRTIALSKEGDAEGRFTFKMDNDCQAENYTLIVTMGTMENGVFTQTHKEARLNIKPKAANAKIKATAKYTLNPYGVNRLPFVVSGGDYDVWFTNESLDGNFAQNMIMKGGEPNEFNRFFEITAAEDSYNDAEGSTIAIRQDLTQDELELLADKDYMKNNLTGYVSLSNGQQELDVKVTVALKAFKDMKLKAQATPTTTGKVVTDIQVLNGKEPVDIEAYSISGNSLDFKPYYTKDMGDTPEQKAEAAAAEADRLENGIIRVVAEDAKKGNQKFDLKVVTKDTADGYKYDLVTKNGVTDYDRENCLLTNAVTVSGTIKVAETKTAKNKIVFAKGATNWKVTSNDWCANDDNETKTPWYGWYTERTYTFKNRLSGVAKVNVETDKTWAHIEGQDYSDDSVQHLDITIDKNELESKMTAEKLKWGKAAKVKATFSYLDKDGKTLDIPKDTVTFAITLPEEPGFENAASLYSKVVENQAKFQNLADRKFKEHYNEHYDDEYDEDDTRTTVEKAADDVRDDLQRELENLAKGTTAMLNVTWEYKEGKYVFTLHVEGQTVDVSCAFGASLDAVAQELESMQTILRSGAEKDKKALVEKLGLKYSPMTEASALQTALKGLLDGKRLLTNNMSISVDRVDGSYNEVYGSYAPTTEHDGQFVADVTVVDRSVRSGNNSETVTLYYSFAELKGLGAYTGDGTESIKTKLDSAKLAELINEAYFELGKGIADDHVFSVDMEEALRAKITAFAKTLIADNEYLSVAEVNKASFTVEYVDSTDSDGPADAWDVSFTITYNDATPDAKEPTFDVEVPSVKALFTTFTGKKEVSDLKDAAEAAMKDANWTLDAACNTKDLAIAAIRKFVTDAVKNPSYKADTQLKVELDGEEAEAFKAPVKEGETITAAGWINVAVNYDATNEASLPEHYTFTIGSTKAGESETAAEKNARIKDRVKAVMTATAINNAVDTAYEATPSATNEELKTAVAASLKTTAEGSQIASDSVTVASVTVATLGLPKDSKTDGTYGEITVALSYTDTEGGTQTPDVTIDGGALKAKDLYQSEKEFRDALAAEFAKDKTLVDYNADYLEEVSDGEATTTQVVEAKKPDIITAIQNKAQALVTIATNPQFDATYASTKITATKTDESDTGKNDGSQFTYDPETGRITVTKVVLTIGDESEAGKKDNTVEITAKVGGPEDRELVWSINFNKIGDVAPTTEKDGTTAPKAIEITAPKDDVAWLIDAKVEGTRGLQTESKVVNWELKQSDGSTAWSSVSDGNAKDKIKLSKDGKKLEVTKDAFITGNDITVCLHGVVNKDIDTNHTGAKNEIDVFVKIKIEEDYDVVIKDADGESAPTTTLEAPASGDGVTYTYTAVVKGSHIKDATKAEFDKPTSDDTGVTFAYGSEGVDKTTLVATVASIAKDHEKITLTAKVAGTDPLKSATQDISVKSAETLKKAAALDFDKTVTSDDWAWNDGVLTIQNATVKPVVVPFTIADTTHDWTKATFAVTVKGTEQQGITDAVVAANIKAAQGEKKDKGKFLMTVNNDLKEVLPAAPAAGETPAVVAPELILTATLEEDGKATVTTSLDFKIVVVKKFTDVNFVAAITGGEDQGASINKDSADSDRSWTVTTASTGDTKVSFANSKLVGAHVSANGDDQTKDVTWSIKSKNAGSTADIDKATGELTIPEGSKDRVIRVQVSKKISDTETLTRYTTINVE